MRRPTRLLLVAGLGLEFALGLYPPMRMNITTDGQFHVGRTDHFFIFSRLGGAWTIDAGRFMVYAFLLAVGVLLCAVLESWLHSRRATNEGSSAVTRL
jgi:hypothetical protein